MTVGYIRYLCATCRQQTMHLSQYKINQSPSIFVVASLRICPSHILLEVTLYFSHEVASHFERRAPSLRSVLRSPSSLPTLATTAAAARWLAGRAALGWAGRRWP